MKKTGFTHRVLAMLLVLIMIVQLIPTSVLAFGELRAVDTSIDVGTLNKEDAIKWPIKIYDYLDDGMLFEWNDTTHTGNMAVGHTASSDNTVPYGGGAHPVVTKLGSDFTYAASTNLASSGYNSLWYWRYNNTNYYGNAYIPTKVDAVDYETPYHVRITDGNYTGHNLALNYFASDQSTAGNIRYMVMVYRADKIEDYYFSISCTTDTSGTGWSRAQTTLPDSSEWTYKIFDLYSLHGTKTDVQHIWLTWHSTTSWSSTSNTTLRGMNSGAYVNLTHVGYFDNLDEAKVYGEAAVKFDKNPGEYLHKTSSSFTATTTTVTPAARLNNYIFSLHYRWLDPHAYPVMFGTDSTSVNYTNTWYGMDFTTTSRDNGQNANAYTSETFWTWVDGSYQSYKFTNSSTGVTDSKTFVMDAIGVERKEQSNGALYVRLTSDSPSRIMLSKFREDHSKVYETYVPLTSDVEYMVMVYRPNNLTAEDQFALWAQGYEEATCDTAGHKWASNWKYAGLTDDTKNWATADNINPFSLGTTSGWQYVIIPLTETIREEDSNMQVITRTARTGLYLPELSEGKSLDLAYVSYFRSHQYDTAKTFAEAAVNYMNTKPAVSTSTTTGKTWGSSRNWKTGNNKGFGMLYSTGAGNWSGTTAGGTNSTDAFGYDTWMIGYPTNQLSSTAYATNRKNPVTLENYTAFYTDTSSDKFLTDAAGTTNNIYFISGAYSDDGNSTAGFSTEVVPFDGYQLLETVTSGIMTAGLLEGSLHTVTIDGVDYRVPVYRQETVEYIAYLLVHSLRIPQRDASGNYNCNFVSGSASTQFGGVDLNGDGVIGWIDLDGDSRNGNECNEASVDLATALRHCLGITLPIGANVGTGGEMGTYAETLAKSRLLIGKFSQCRSSIDTAMDAAYYMLNSLFIADSFNQEQDDYYYLTMPSAEVALDGFSDTAYVFDAGFTTGLTATDGTIFTDDGTNKSAINYSPLVKDDGTGGTGTIYMEGVTGKTQFNFSQSSGTYSWTTRFPFLPVTDAEGDYAGQTDTYYFWNDDVRTYTTGSNSYIGRNYNYVIASNGEFVYTANDNLFFDFEGDDDVYLFINGELVLDIGAAHSITSVNIKVNDYVEKARAALKELTKYGYVSTMTHEEFDAMISASTLEEYVYDESTGNITGSQTVTNPYNPTQIAAFKRWARLDLVDGEICQFDFYYMERHGWGANMRIVTNMHITDPALDVDKTAYQFGNEVEFGGVIDPTSSLEYNFSLTNSGNTKLYNLTFEDQVLGVKLDPTNGLTVSQDMDGKYVMDASGGTLEPKDLRATVKGYNAAGEFVEVPITFTEIIDENGVSDNGLTALKNFLSTLQAEGTESGLDDAEVTRAGSGLWVDATVTIKGIYYMLTPEQTEDGYVHNTVYLTATTRRYPDTIGNKTLYSDAEHLVYTSGFPVHYQWAGHNIFMNMNTLITNAKIEAGKATSQLNLYNKFFSSISDVDDIYYNLCDKYGRTGGNYPYQTKGEDGVGNEGYLINYKEPGVYTFYLLLYKKSGTKDGQNIDYASSGIDATDIGTTDYAIVRSQVYVADVTDSVYVLDYGLSTESLDMDGELFKDDYLFGPYGTIRAKLMGVTGTEPYYIDPATATTTDYSRISFAAQNILEDDSIKTGDGLYKVNLAIPESGGKLIGYDSTTGQYTLTGVGTVKITVDVPTGGTNDTDWATPHLYYWYDDGSTGPGWPGTLMTADANGGGRYEIDIPADVTHVIINNGSAALQTENLSISPGMQSHITVTTTKTENNKLMAVVETIIEEITYYAKVAKVADAETGTETAVWDKVYLHYLVGETWETVESSGTDGDYYAFTIPGDVTKVYLSDGADKRTAEQTVYAGKEVWFDIGSTVTDGNYDVSVKYTLSEGYEVHATVPASWGDEIYVYYWYEGSEGAIEWPGVKMTKGDFWYNLDGDSLIPADVTHLIINDGKNAEGETTARHQTIDLTVTPGLETWIMVENQTTIVGGNTRYTANVLYGSASGSTGLTFTPQTFMDEANEMWLALTVHATSARPSKLNDLIDVHNEVQMYKKITVVPATVVYYEDSFEGNPEEGFEGINYNKNTANVFEHHGTGTGTLTLSQSIDQDQPYGQDATYQDESNSQYSGGSMVTFQILDTDQLATFTFTGTGFELISRTNASDSASIVARVYKSANYSAGAYELYLRQFQAKQAYDKVNTTYDAAVKAYNAIGTAYTAVQNAYEAADTAYDEALTAYNAWLTAAAGEDAEATQAAAEAYNTKLEAYNVLLQTYEAAKKAYEKTPAAYKAACREYDAAVKAYEDAYWKYDLDLHNFVDGVCIDEGCGKVDPGVCEHTYGGGVVTASTCVTTGYTTYTCTNCGHSYTDDETVVQDHSYTSVVTAATCFAGGYTTNTCTVCANSYVDNKTDALTHIMGDDGLCTLCGSSEQVSKPATATTVTKIEATAPAEPAKATTFVEPIVNDPTVKVLPLITQFDHGGDGGSENISQVPALRVTGLEHGEYTVEICGVPTNTFNGETVTGNEEVYLYIDGLRIYEPMGKTHDAYSDKENGAQILELRDMIAKGQVAVGTIKDGSLTLSSAITTWTESLFDNDFASGKEETYEGIQVDTTDDYVLQGPNNEVYMEGNATNSAMVFYVTKNADSQAHELQIAVRALDYSDFYGAGSSGLNAQLQYGVLLNSGSYAWKNLVHVVSGTEQYYSIPFEECPMDSAGRYQVVLRVVNNETGKAAMVSYSNVKLTGLSVQKVQGLGESSILYYKDGFLIHPKYYLVGTINGQTVDLSTAEGLLPRFLNGKLTLTLKQPATVSVMRELLGEYITYKGTSDLGTTTSVTLYDSDSATYQLTVPAGEVTFTLRQTEEGSLTLSYCVHNWNAGQITKEATCTANGIKTYTCTKCAHTKTEEVAPDPNNHSYSGGICVRCGDEESKYYLIGTINGGNYGCEEDSANLGDYVFVDGKLVVTFTQGSYVFVKAEDNVNYFMTQSYDKDATSVTLYNTNTGSSEKMFAPGGIELTFTLVENEDGTLTLSYTHPCIHEWDEGVITEEPTCTETGYKLHTCTLCGESKTELVDAIDHTYVDHICSSCGDYEMMTVYFNNSDSWSTVYIWAWNSNKNNENYTGGNWPGAVMSLVNGTTSLYSYEIPVITTHVIFSNGSGTQTGDLSLPTDGNNQYNYSNGSWTLKAEVLDYYLIGYINGADYGCNDDKDNLGIYKFVDGKLVVTFESDSYVFVKTTGNTSWFMTQTYDETAESVTLYNTNTGSSEKMFAPGGIELTFKLVENEDGTLTLSYTRPCVHEWDEGTVTTAPTCTESGVKTITCGLCGESYTEVIAATGHIFTEESPDTCTVCDTDRTHTIYFVNKSGWENVYLWAWTDGTNYTGGNWPGVTMTAVEGEENLYSAEISVKAVNAIFSNGTIETATLTIPTDGNTQYNSHSGTWSALGEEVVVEYCLIGYIEGADSGTGDDWEDTTSYLFSDSIVVTFTQDAYIGVKKADNSTWYWTSYCEDTTCTFYSSGYSDKQKVPAGTWVITLVNNGNGTVTMSYAAYSEVEAEASAASMSYSMSGMYLSHNDSQTANLLSIDQQLSSNVVYGEDEIF